MGLPLLSVSARVLLPFSPTIALQFQATDCCSHAQGSCRKDIYSLSAHFTAQQPWHHWPDPFANYNWTLQLYESNATTFFFDSTGNENQSRASMSPQNKDNMFCGCLSGMAGRSISEYEPVWARLVSTIALYLVTSSAFTICHGLCAYVTRMVEQREERDKGVAASLQAVENKEYCEKSIIGFHPCGYLI